MKPLISIVIVNWNARDNLNDCLASLKKVDNSSLEIILVDNGSSDGSVGLVRKNFPKVLIVRSSKNLGFAEGNNLGYKKCKGEYILFLNNDTLVTENFLSELVNFIKERPDVGIVQPAIIFHRPGTSLHHKINSVGSFLLKSGFLYHLNYGKNFEAKNYNMYYEIFSAYGACFLARKSVIDKVGLFDKDYFAYFEETDLCQRIWLSGFKVMVLPSVFIYHKGAKTAEKLPTSFIQYHSFKNRLYTYLKNFGKLNILRIFIPHLLICEISSLLYFIIGKPSYALAIQRAIMWNILNCKKMLRERKKVQNIIRKVKDNEFIPKLTKKANLRYYYFLSNGQLERHKE